MRLFRPVLLFAAVLALGACVGGGASSRADAGYRLGGVSSPVQAAQKDLRPLIVAPVGVRTPYDQAAIAFTNNGMGPTFYPNSFWAEPLSQQVRTRVGDFLRRSGAFASVSEGETGQPGELVLNTSVLQFEQVLVDKFLPAVTVSVAYSVYDPSNDIVLISALYTEKLPVPKSKGPTMDQTVVTMTQALDRTLERFVRDLDNRK
jgi:ABC-type uncharacterized transport system auxiliary subunit